MAVNIGPRIGIDGEKEFRRAMREIKAEVEYLEAAMRNTEAGFKDNDTAMKKAGERAKILRDEEEALKKQVEYFKDAVQKSTEALGENDTRTFNWKRQLELAEEQLKNVQAELKNNEGWDAYREQLRITGEKLEGIGDTLSGAGRTLTRRVTAPILGAGTAAVKLATDYEYSAAQVFATSQDLGKSEEERLEEQAALMEVVDEIAKRTQYTQAETMDAALGWARAGYTSAEIQELLGDSTNFAIAAALEQSEATDILATMLRAYNFDASETSHVTDVLLATMTNSVTDMYQLAEAFKYMESETGAMGYSMEDSAFAIGLFSNRAIQGSRAGTSLRNILTNLANPTDKMAKVMNKYGYSLEMVGETGEYAMPPLRDVLTMIRDNLGTARFSVEAYQAQLEGLDEQLESGTLTEDEYAQAVEDLSREMYGVTGATAAADAAAIAGKRGMGALMALAATSDDDWNKLANAIDGASDTIDGYDGKTEQMVGIMSGTAQFAFYRFRSQAQALGESFGRLMLPALEKVTEWLGGLMDKLSQLDPGTKEMIIKIALAVAAIGPLLLVVGKTIALFGQVAQGIAAIKNIAGLLKFGAVGLAIAGIGAAILLIVTHWDTIKEKVIDPAVEILGRFAAWADEKIVQPIKDALAWFDEHVGTFFRETLPEWWAGVVEAWNGFWDGIGQGISDFLAWVNEKVEAVKKFFKETIPEWWEGVVEDWNAFWDGIGQGIKDFIAWVNEKVDAIKKFFKETLPGWWDGVVESWNGFWDGIGQGIRDFFTWIGEKVDKIRKFFTETVPDWWNGLWEDVRTGWNYFKEHTIDPIIDVFRKLWEDHLSPFITDLQEGWDAMWSGLQTAWNWVKTTLFDPIHDTVEWVLQGFRDFWDFVSGVFSGDKKLEFPSIKLPHFSIEGSFSLAPPSVPKLHIEWYKKAMDNGMILRNPTIFGAAGGRLLGAGEAGAEVVVGLSSLRGMIGDAVRGAVLGGGSTTIGGTTVNIYGTDRSTAKELYDEIEERLGAALERRLKTW